MISDIASVVADYVVDHLVIDDIVNNSRIHTNEFDETWILHKNIHDDLILITERRPYPMRMLTRGIHKTVMIDKDRLFRLLLESDGLRIRIVLKVEQWVVDDMMHQLSLSARRITAILEKIDHPQETPASQSRAGRCIIL